MADEVQQMTERRKAYQEMTRDPDFLALPPADRQEMGRKVLFPGSENVGAESPIMPAAASGLKALSRAAPFPGVIKGLTGQDVSQYGDQGGVLTPLPDIVTEPFATAVDITRKLFGHDAAKTLQDLPGALSMGSIPGGLQSIRNLGLYRRQPSGLINEGRFNAATDVTPEPPLRISGPEAKLSAATEPVPVGPRPQIMSPAQGSASVFERQLAAEDALRASPRGANLLRAQLYQQQDMNPPEVAPVPITPEIIPPARAAAIAKGRARIKPVMVPNAETKPPPIQATAGEIAPPVVEAARAEAAPEHFGWMLDKPIRTEPHQGISLDRQRAIEAAGEPDVYVAKGPQGLVVKKKFGKDFSEADKQYLNKVVEYHLKERLRWEGNNGHFEDLPAAGAPKVAPVLTASEVVAKIEAQQNPEFFDKPKIEKQVAKGGDTYVKTEVDQTALIVPGEKKVEPGVSVPDKGPIVVDDKGKVIDGRHRVVDAKAAGETTIEAYVPEGSKFTQPTKPFTSMGEPEQLEATISGQKPLFSTNTESPNYEKLKTRAQEAGLQIIEGAQEPFIIDRSGKLLPSPTTAAVVMFKSGQETAAKDLLARFESKSRTPQDHRAIGKLLGYSDKEIGKFAPDPTTIEAYMPAEKPTALAHAIMLAKSGQGLDFIAKSLRDNYQSGPQQAINIATHAQETLKPKIVTPQVPPPIPDIAMTKEAVPVKHPWEMTRDEYLDKFGRAPRGVINGTKTESARIIRLPNGNTVTTGEHGKAVYDAIIKGEIIPPEVLAEYPDLQGKALTSSRGAILPDQPYQQPPGQREPQKGDWVEYKDSYGKTHQGKIDEIFQTRPFVPGRPVSQQPPARTTYHIVDAGGKVLMPPVEGIAPQIIDEPKPYDINVAQAAPIVPPSMVRSTPVKITIPISSLLGGGSIEITAERLAGMRGRAIMAFLDRKVFQHGQALTPQEQEVYEKAKLARLKEILDKKARGESITLEEEDFFDDIQKPKKNRRIAMQGRIADFEQEQQAIIDGAKTILGDPDTAQATRDAAQEAMLEAERMLNLSQKNAIIDVPPDALGNPVIEPIDIAPEQTQITQEAQDVPGQLLPSPLGVDVREPTGVSSGVSTAGEIEGAPGQQGTAGAAVSEPIEGQSRPVGGAGAGTGDIVAARPARRPRVNGGRSPTADTGEGTGIDLPEVGSIGPSGEPQGQVAVPAGPSGVSLNHSLPRGANWIPSGDKSRVEANLQAIRLVKTLEAENRYATPQEQEILAKWVGWGGLKPVFDEGKAYYREHPPPYYQYAQIKESDNWEKKWGKLYDAVKASLTREEWDAAFESTANAHYTSREVINQMWSAVERLGFTGGNAMEPAAGSGNFIGLTPDSLKNTTKWRAVELDNMTARIAAKLYPEARVENGPFEKSRVAPNSQDLVISNVPFLSIDKTAYLDKRYPHLSLHNYFFVRGLDLVKPGGLMVSITSMSTMDAPVSEVGRNLIAEKADLVGAFRLPNTAFAENAGTEVTTDILFFRKKDNRLFDKAQPFKQLANTKTYDGREIRINEYFVNHPENILGRMSLEGTQYGKDEPAVLPFDEKGEAPGASLPWHLGRAVERLPKNVFGAAPSAPTAEALTEMAGFTDKPGRLIIRNGVVKKVMETGELESVAWGADRKKIAQTKSYISVRDSARSLIDLEMSKDATEADMDVSRATLNQWYDDYTRRYGQFNSIGAKFLFDDGDFTLGLSLEIPETTLVDAMRGGRRVIKRETTYRKSSLFTQRVSFPDPTPERADTISDGLQISMNFRGDAQPDYIAELTGQAVENVKAELESSGLAFENPATGQWESRSEYLSGNVKEKLQQAKGASEDDPRYVKHVEELEKVQPPPVPIEKIGFKLGSKWMPPDLIQEFVKDVLEVNADVSTTAETGTWHVVEKWGGHSEKNTTIFGSGRVTGVKMVELAMNLKSPVITKTESAPELAAGYRTVKDKEATLEAEWKQQQLQDEFKAYVLGKPHWGEQLETIFNERFNTTIERVFDPPSWIHYPGASHDIVLYEHQKRAITRGIHESTGLFHSVGLGKTFVMATWAMELKRLELAHKPMIVTQNATTEQFARQFRRLYPNAKILAPTETERSAEQRNTLMSRIATENWDAIIVPQSFVNTLPDAVERTRKYIQDQIDELKSAMSEAAAKEGKNAPKVKDIRAAVKKLTGQLEKLADRKTDDLFTFEQLGIDALAVDEFHAYKRLQFNTELENIKGLDTSFSQRGLSMYMKMRWVGQNRNGKNLQAATGTPVSNTIAETWNIMRYLRPDLLEKNGIERFDDFVGLFVTPRTALEMGPTGQFKLQTRLAKFSNQPALMQMWKSVADVKLQEDVALPNVPSIKGGKPQTVEVEKTEELSGFIDELNKMLEAFSKMSGREKRENRHIPLVVFGLARKSTIDMRMIDPKLPDQPGSKLNRAVKEMLRIYQATTDVKGTQMGFIDLYQNDPDDPTFNAYEEIKRKLMEGGIPEREILIMTDKIKGAKREAMFERLNAGEIRIALGSRERMGIGVNAQEHIAAIHQIDVPHRPMDIEQSNGRGLRPRDNSEIPEIEILYYGVKETLDAAMYDQLATKSKWIAQLLKGNLPGFDFNDPFDEASLSFDQQMALLSGNPGAVRKIFLENEIRQLEAMRTGHAREMRDAAGTLRFLQETTIPGFQKSIEKADRHSAAIVPAFAEGVDYALDIGGKTIPGRKDVVAGISSYFGRKAKATIEAAQKAGIVNDIQSKPFVEMAVNGIPIEMFLTIESRVEEVTPGILTDLRLKYGISQKYKEEYDKAIDNGSIKVAHAPDSTTFYWRFAGEGQPDFKAFSDAEGKATTGDGLLHSLKAAAERIARRPDDLRNQLQSKEKDVRNLSGFVGTPFAKEDQLKGLRIELQDLLKTLGQNPAQAVQNASNVTMIDAGEIKDDGPPSEGELEIEMTAENAAKVSGLKRSLDSALEHGDMARANELREQITKLQENPG